MEEVGSAQWWVGLESVGIGQKAQMRHNQMLLEKTSRQGRVSCHLNHGWLVELTKLA